MLPKEHGAYGQVSFPLLTAFLVAGMSTGGLFIAVAMVAGFFAHEPAAALLGLRGGRVRRELRHWAIWWLGCAVAIGIAAGIGALVTMRPAARWSLAVPLAPALLLAIATGRGQEKSWYGETAASLAFSGAAVPVSMAVPTSLEMGAAVAIPFAVLFVAGTLSVRVVLVGVRGGGKHPDHDSGSTRRAFVCRRCVRGSRAGRRHRAPAGSRSSGRDAGARDSSGHCSVPAKLEPPSDTRMDSDCGVLGDCRNRRCDHQR